MRCRRTGNEASTHTCCVCVCVSSAYFDTFFSYSAWENVMETWNCLTPNHRLPLLSPPPPIPFWKEKFADWSASGAKIQNSNSNESKSFKTRNKRQEEVDNWKVLAAAIDKFTTGHWWWAQLFFFTNDCARKKKGRAQEAAFWHLLLPFITSESIRRPPSPPK